MRRPLLVATLLSTLACAAARVPLDRADADAALVAAASARALAVAGLRAWVAGGDRPLAERRADQALARDGREPWGNMASALLAARRLDDHGEVAHLLAVVGEAPSHPLAPLALARLQRLVDRSPGNARRIDAGLTSAQPSLTGLAATRARLARAAARDLLGDRRGAEQLRAETAPVVVWTLAGPFGALHALEFDEPYAPERGAIPREVPLADGVPAAPSRPIPAPDGVVTFEGETAGGDLFYLAADVVAAQGGEYLLSIRTAASVRVWLDGAPVLERRAFATPLSSHASEPMALAPGKHQLLLKVARGGGRGDVGVALPRADGAPADLTFLPTPPGAALPPVRAGAGRWPERTRALFAQLTAEAGPEVAALLAGAEVREWDREGAKVILREALRATPGSPPLLALRADVVGNDPSWNDRAARAAAEASLDRALGTDPGDAATRLARAERMLEAGRGDDAATLLEPLAKLDPPRSRALLARARIARARNLPVLAERLAEEARRVGGECAAIELLLGLPARRNAVAKQDEDAEAFARCRGGLEPLAEHRQRRGDLAGALEVADELVRGSPARIEARFTRAALLAAAGRPADGAEDLARLAAIWPRDPRIEKRRAELLEAGGEVAAARASRERALLLDPSDLALRRALGLERLQVPLDDVAEDGLAAIARYRAAAPRYTTSTATVLDFAAVEVHPGGAYTERTHTVVEARDQRAVDHVGEVTVPDGAELLRARTIKRDGALLEAEEPLGDKRSLSLTGLEPGDFAEWEWIRTIPSRGPAIPGFTADAFFFRADMPLWRSTYVVRAPAQVGLEIDAHGTERPAPGREGDWLVLRTTYTDVPPLLAEPGAPVDAEQLPFVQVGAGASVVTLARAIGDALVDAYRPTLEVQAFAEEIRTIAPSPAKGVALVRAAYRRVTERILGSGGFEEPASVILSRGSGNRTVALKAVLAALGVRSRVALVRDFARDPAPYRFPRPDQWAYAVLRVEVDGEVIWLDPTTRLSAYGTLPPGVRGAEAVVLPEPGEQVLFSRVPADDGDRERRRATLDLLVDEGGGATIEGREEYRGYAAASLRTALEQLDGPSRRQMTEQALSRSFRGPVLQEVAFDGEGDPEALLVVRYRARVERWARVEEGRAIAETPLLPARLGARFLQLATRQRALLIGVDERTSLVAQLRVPAGWKPVAETDASVEARFGAFRRRERVEGKSLRREETFDLARGRVAPAQYQEFAGWARAVDAAQRRPVVFELPAAGRPIARSTQR